MLSRMVKVDVGHVCLEATKYDSFQHLAECVEERDGTVGRWELSWFVWFREGDGMALFPLLWKVPSLQTSVEDGAEVRGDDGGGFM